MVIKKISTFFSKLEERFANKALIAMENEAKNKKIREMIVRYY